MDLALGKQLAASAYWSDVADDNNDVCIILKAAGHGSGSLLLGVDDASNAVAGRKVGNPNSSSFIMRRNMAHIREDDPSDNII